MSVVTPIADIDQRHWHVHRITDWRVRGGRKQGGRRGPAEPPAAPAPRAAEFYDPKTMPELRSQQWETLLFEVLASELRDGDNNLLAECPPYELVQTVQAEVDKIVAAAKARSVN
jgi:hypothetical protein